MDNAKLQKLEVPGFSPPLYIPDEHLPLVELLCSLEHHPTNFRLSYKQVQ
jgi:hypothetical protein